MDIFVQHENGEWGWEWSSSGPAIEQAKTDQLIREKQAKVRGKVRKEVRGEAMDDKDKKIQMLQEDLHIAEHRAFAAEVSERRAHQKRRNQRKELKQLHRAINEKNNRIRNLELANGALKRLVDPVKQYPTSLRIGLANGEDDMKW